MPEYFVSSYHLNVESGDSAIHVLCEGSKLMSSGSKVVSATLVDGGIGRYGDTVLPGFLISQEIKKYFTRNNAQGIGFFDSVIVSHWDEDHAEGFYRLFATNLEASLSSYIQDNNITDNDKLKQDIKSGQVKCSFLNYKAGRPVSVLYCPYWVPGRSYLRNQIPRKRPNRVRSDGLGLCSYEDNVTKDYVTFKVPYKLYHDDVKREISVPGLMLGPLQNEAIGMDMFSNTRILKMNDALNPNVIAEAMHSMPIFGADRPAMICVGCDGQACDWENRAERDARVWADGAGRTDIEEMDLADLTLIKASTNSMPQQQSNSSNISISAIEGAFTTGNNQASVVAMIIWPQDQNSSEEIEVSHYFAGDAGDEVEERILRWATIPDAQNADILRPVRVSAMKISHHGSKASSPVFSLYAWRPYAILGSNGLNHRYKHCLWMENASDRGNGKRYFWGTNLPIYTITTVVNNQSIENLNPGSIASLDPKRMGKNFRALAKKLNAQLPAFTSLSNINTKEAVARWVHNRWPSISNIREDSYGAVNSQIDGKVRAESQNVRLVYTKQNRNRYACGYAAGPSIKDVISRRRDEIQGPSSTALPKAVVDRSLQATAGKPPMNAYTESDPFSPNRRQRLSGTMCGTQTFNALLRDDYDEDDDNNEAPRGVTTTHYHSHSLQRALIRSARCPVIAAASQVYVIASDTIMVSAPPSTVLKVTPATNLNLLVGDMETGAFVFASSLPAETVSPRPLTPFDGTDELSQWIMDSIGSFDDQDVLLSAAACVSASTNYVQVSGINFRTKLQFACNTTATKPSSEFFTTPVVFDSVNNGYAFDIKNPETNGNWPNVPSTGTVDIVGHAHVLCFSLGPSPSVAEKIITGLELLDFLNLEALDNLHWLASPLKLTLDVATGARNAIWVSPGATYQSTLRLKFKPEDGSASSLNQSITSLLGGNFNLSDKIKVKNSALIGKKIWQRLPGLTMIPSSELAATAQVTLNSSKKSLTFDTVMVISSAYLEWIIDFDGQASSLQDLLDFIVDVFSTGSVQNVGSFLPGSENILLRRLSYKSSLSSNGPAQKEIMVVFQISFAGMLLLCTLDAVFTSGKPDLVFSGRLFPENRPERLGDNFSWIPYMPDYEPWNAMQIKAPPATPGNVTALDVGGSDVGNLGVLFNKLTGGTLPAAPFELDLVGLTFSVSSQELAFGAIVTSSKPENSSKPVFQLEQAILDFRYDLSGSGGVTKLSLTTSISMSAPDPNIQPAKWGLVLDRTNTVWSLTGSVSGLSGNLLYSLFDNDANVEMSQLLANVDLDLSMVYTYDTAGKASSFKVDGALHLGDLELHMIYDHPSASDWTLHADLAVAGQKGTLLGIIESICGPDLMDSLPDCVKNVDVSPSADGKLTSLDVIRAEEYLIVTVRLQITTNLAVAFYQIQKKRTDPASTTAPPVKRALVFSANTLPAAKEIPAIGELPQPFDELRFLWATSSSDAEKGWTKKEVETINNKLALGFPKLVYKTMSKDGDDPAAIVLPMGIHFCILNNEDVLLDYLAGQKKTGSSVVNRKGVSDGFSTAAATAPINKTLGPVKILGVGFDFDLSSEVLTLTLDGTLTLGPMEMTLVGFSVSFSLKSVTLTNLEGLNPTFTLDGLGLAFEKAPLSVAGMFQRKKTKDSDMFMGGAVVGFSPWTIQAGGYYGTSSDTPGDTYKSFLAYLSLSGPIATLGYVEIRGITGGFGYNTTVRIPDMQNVTDFPFLSSAANKTPSEALTIMLTGVWFSNKKGQNWVAAGLTILAFELLQVSAVVLVEWGSGVKLGVFGLATAEMPKGAPEDAIFVRVQLGVVATIDFDAGILKVDGQLTPASFVLDRNCHLTGGFALYSWFGDANASQQGDWVFTIGGFHPAFQKPSQYPNPPRLGISWSYDSSINITGEAYFALTPKACMGGGSLRVTMTLGALYAYLNAFADFLINYKPFMYSAQGGVEVGVHYTLDLWLVSIPINISLGCTVYINGPPLAGRVHVDFYVFGFDVNFGSQRVNINKVIGLTEFYELVLQASQKGKSTPLNFLESDVEEQDESGDAVANELPAPHVLTCISGLVPQNGDKDQGATTPGETWVVRGAVFAFTVACKFAVQEATVTTNSASGIPEGPPFPVENKATATIFGRPMHRQAALGQSLLEIAIQWKPPARALELRPLASNPLWNVVEANYSNVPNALWAKYDPAQDPSNSNSDPSSLLQGDRDLTSKLMTGLTLHAPGDKRSADCIAAFDVRKAMGSIAGSNDFPPPTPVDAGWVPAAKASDPAAQFADVKSAWEKSSSAVPAAAKAMAEWGIGGWNWDLAKQNKVTWPERYAKGLEKWLVEAPCICTA